MGTPWSVERIDDKVACQPTEELHDADTDNAFLEVFVQTVLNLFGRFGSGQCFRQNICVLDSLASTCGNQENRNARTNKRMDRSVVW